MESIHIKETNERYITSLIQNYISIANQSRQQVNVAQESQHMMRNYKLVIILLNMLKLTSHEQSIFALFGKMYNRIRKNILIKEWKKY